MDNDASAIIDFAKSGIEPKKIDLDVSLSPGIVFAPNTLTAHDVEKFVAPHRKAPIRKTGTIRVHDETGLFDAIAYHREPTTRIAVNRNTGSVIATINAHGPGATDQRYQDFSVVFEAVESKKLKTWKAACDRPMSSQELNKFLEDNINDITAPPTTKANADSVYLGYAASFMTTFGSKEDLILATRGIKTKTNATFKEEFDPNTGNMNLEVSSQTTGNSGARLKIPGLFLIAIPLFEHDASYRIAVRLKYVVSNGGITWFVSMVCLQDAIDDVIKNRMTSLVERFGDEFKIGGTKADVLPACLIVFGD